MTTKTVGIIVATTKDCIDSSHFNSRSISTVSRDNQSPHWLCDSYGKVGGKWAMRPTIHKFNSFNATDLFISWIT